MKADLRTITVACACNVKLNCNCIMNGSRVNAACVANARMQSWIVVDLCNGAASMCVYGNDEWCVATDAKYTVIHAGCTEVRTMGKK